MTFCGFSQNLTGMIKKCIIYFLKCYGFRLPKKLLCSLIKRLCFCSQATIARPVLVSSLIFAMNNYSDFILIPYFLNYFSDFLSQIQDFFKGSINKGSFHVPTRFNEPILCFMSKAHGFSAPKNCFWKS